MNDDVKTTARALDDDDLDGVSGGTTAMDEMRQYNKTVQKLEAYKREHAGGKYDTPEVEPVKSLAELAKGQQMDPTPTPTPAPTPLLPNVPRGNILQNELEFKFGE